MTDCPKTLALRAIQPMDRLSLSADQARSQRAARDQARREHQLLTGWRFRPTFGSRRAFAKGRKATPPPQGDTP